MLLPKCMCFRVLGRLPGQEVRSSWLSCVAVLYTARFNHLVGGQQKGNKVLKKHLLLYCLAVIFYSLFQGNSL